MTRELTGIVLAGGRSSRFGSDKALALLEGRALVERVVSRLLMEVPRVLVVAKDLRPLDFLRGARTGLVEDRRRAWHPLGGLLAGLRRAKTAFSFVCACDMPFIEPALVRALGKAAPGFDAAVPLWAGVPQPLCAVYSKACVGPIERALTLEGLGIRDLLSRLRARLIPETEVRTADPEGISFFDVDTREDLGRAKGILPC